jgi:microcystin-dependent protein
MADTFTLNFNFTLPEVGGSRDSWGSKDNANWTALDAALDKIRSDAAAAVAAVKAVPPGTIAWFGRPSVPDGWLRCNGATLSRTAYADLFSVIGGYFGAPDANTFSLPDLRGVFVRGLDEGRGYDNGRGLSPVIQGSQNLSHAHALTGGGYVFQLYGTGAQITLATGNEQAQPGIHAVSIANDGGNEARPVNMALPACIKY